MREKIIGVSLNDKSIESIYAVTLDHGDYLTIDTLEIYIQLGFSYFFVDDRGKVWDIEIVDPAYKEPYIRTKGSFTIDPLLNLSTY